MNLIHLQQIFDHYIEKFEAINGPVHMEYYKWQIAKRFKPLMDVALNSADDELPEKLYAVRKITQNVIDSYTQPFTGLSKFAEKEPQTVRRMFFDLFADVGSDNPDSKEKAIRSFLKESRQLREKYYPDSYLYKDDMHSVTGYKFLYDPDHNFLYKATHCRDFADCIEFYDEWGYGDAVKLSVFSRMCNEVISEIKNNQVLLSTAASRYSIDPNGMHPDDALHILLFDIIYCCSTYNLFNGISFVTPKNSERKLMQERKEKARQIAEELETAKARLALLTEAKAFLHEIFIPGKTVLNKVFGEGIIMDVTETRLIVNFASVGTKDLGLLMSVANKIISLNEEGYDASIDKYRSVLLQEKQIENAVSSAEKRLTPYLEYLD